MIYSASLASLQPGDIVFLPSLDHLSTTQRRELANLGFLEECLFHPFIINYPGDVNTPAQGWLMTSFCGQSLEAYRAGNTDRIARSAYRIPVIGAPAHPESGHLLHLTGPTMAKPTYIQIETMAKLPFSVLQLGNIQKQKLPIESLDELRALYRWSESNPIGSSVRAPIPSPRNLTPPIPDRKASIIPFGNASSAWRSKSTPSLPKRDLNGSWRRSSSGIIDSSDNEPSTTSTPATTPTISAVKMSPMGHFSHIPLAPNTPFNRSMGGDRDVRKRHSSPALFN